jgi:hypothetical protein
VADVIAWITERWQEIARPLRRNPSPTSSDAEANTGTPSLFKASLILSSGRIRRVRLKQSLVERRSLFPCDLDLEAPLAVCGHYIFATASKGEWTVEDGRLVFRAAADPQTRRGPDLEGCCASDHTVWFAGIRDDWNGNGLPAINWRRFARLPGRHSCEPAEQETWAAGPWIRESQWGPCKPGA